VSNNLNGDGRKEFHKLPVPFNFKKENHMNIGTVNIRVKAPDDMTDDELRRQHGKIREAVKQTIRQHDGYVTEVFLVTVTWSSGGRISGGLDLSVEACGEILGQLKEGADFIVHFPDGVVS
jgi:hypothetical protein